MFHTCKLPFNHLMRAKASEKRMMIISHDINSKVSSCYCGGNSRWSDQKRSDSTFLTTIGLANRKCLNKLVEELASLLTPNLKIIRLIVRS